MKFIRFLILSLFFLFSKNTFTQTTYLASPGDYLGFLPLLGPSDTLLLQSGTYTNRLNLDDIMGEENAPVVIMGPEGTHDAVFTGEACCNTVSIERCAWLEIRNLTLDGLNIPNIDAVKAEGTPGNWTHHITVEDLLVINHGGAPLTVGINTKCPAWDWIIRRNTFIEPGLGMYLGNSDGTAPFINGLIEYNLIINPLRYGLQIKHQNEGLRTIPGMTLNGKTVLRYNVISKAENGDPTTPRPNLLVGNFPATGDGSSDYYEIYGNFLWQNPTEGLFQGTGNVTFYNNILVNYQPGGWGVFSFPHNGFAPRNMFFFNNTILSASEGIEINNPNPDYEQLVAGNAIFAANPLVTGSVPVVDNVTDELINAANYLVNPASGIAGLDLTPLPATLEGSALDFSPFSSFENNDIDFDGNLKGWDFRGAYAKTGASDWQLALEMRPEVEGMTTSVYSRTIPRQVQISVFPNPARETVSVRFEEPLAGRSELRLFGLSGSLLHSSFLEKGTTEAEIALPQEHAGTYWLAVFFENKVIARKLLAGE